MLGSETMSPIIPKTSEEYLKAVRSSIAEIGRRKTFDKLIEENNQLIKGSELGNGRDITMSRCAIYHGLMEDWAKEQQESFGYNHPFAVVAIGGTGRDEMTPCSDTDYAFLFDGAIEGNQFLMGLQQQVINSDQFKNNCGYKGEVLPFNLDDVPKMKDKQLNAFLDMKPVYDPEGLADAFRERIRDTYDPFEHFLHVSEIYREKWGESASKNEQLDIYDIKKDGLRVFLAGIWSLAGNEFRHSHQIYEEIEDPRDLEAYYFLLRIRSFIHLYKGTNRRPNVDGSHHEDVFGFRDFMAFGELAGAGADPKTKFEFANEVRSLFLSNRRRVSQFTWGVIGRELKLGRVIRPGSGIVYRTGGLVDKASDRNTDREKSRAALGMLVASQRYGIPIDPAGMESTFRDAGDWMVPVPELSDLFYESRGSLADSMKFLAQLPGALARLFPGYDKFEVSIDERILDQKKCLRGALVREKLRALEQSIETGHNALNDAVDPRKLEIPDFDFRNDVEAALLDDDHLAAIRLALFVKRLPETANDIAARSNTALEIHKRFSSGFSGIPLNRYFEECFADCDFAPETLEIARFLVENRRAFKEYALKDLMNDDRVESIAELCHHDDSLLRTLYIFTSVDRTEWEGENTFPDRWFNIRELYVKATISITGEDSDPSAKLHNLGFSPDQLEVLKNFGNDFYKGIYRQYAVRFGYYLINLKDDKTTPPKVNRFRIGTSNIIGIAAVDHLGIAASISGAFWKLGAELSQAHLFSAATHGLALDFFHLAPLNPDVTNPPSISELTDEITSAIVEKKYISEADEAALPDIARDISLRETAGHLYQLRGETQKEVGALIYYLALKAYRRLGANIYGLAAHTGKGNARASVYISLPRSMNPAEAHRIVETWNDHTIE